MTLYEYLSKFNVTKKQFARKLGISESGLYKLINGEREAKLHTAVKIYKLTSGYVDYEDLLLDESDGIIDIGDDDLL